MKYYWLLIGLMLLFAASCKNFDLNADEVEECLEETSDVECLESGNEDSSGDIDKPEVNSTVSAGYTVLANGKKIGRLLTDSKFYFHTDFQGTVIYKNGEITTSAVYLKNRDCLGAPYSRHIGGMIDNYNLLVPPLKGELFIYQEFLYYYPAGESTFYHFQPQSIYNYHPISGGYCKNLNNLNYDVYIKLRPNNPAVTGIPEYPFKSPVDIVLSKPITVITN